MAMSIAGSDSGGGAGIQADLKTFSALGVYGTIAITSVTAQNTKEVTAIHDLPGWFVYEQIRVVAEDIGVDAAKTGMLSNTDIIESVAKAIREFRIPLVVDPVMIAKSGAKLLRDDAVEALVAKLFPLALVVTPNAQEASVLSGVNVVSLEEAKRAAKIITEKYKTESVVVKGGHLGQDKAVDVLYYRGSFYYFETSRVDGCFHGGGCSYAAAITAHIAMGLDLVEAVGRAKEFIVHAIKHGIKVGTGHCPVNPMAWLEVPAERYRVLERVKQAVQIILDSAERILPHVPEVGLNVVEAVNWKYAISVEDVAGVQGRIVRVGRRLVPVGPVEFGASSNLAKIVLEIMKYDPRVRAAVNIKYSEELINKATARGYVTAYIGRRVGALGTVDQEISTLRIIRDLLHRQNTVPDILYHDGDIGKEPMIVIIGRNAVEVVKKLLDVVA